MDVLLKLHSDEQTFYAASNRGWKLCSDNQPDFFAFNALYTPEYIANAVKDLQAAQALPSYETRVAAQRDARDNVGGAVVACNILVQQLYSIIGLAFAPSKVDNMRFAAGSSFYKSAAAGNLNSASRLYSLVTTFLATYSDDLLSANMPADFADTFSAAQNRFTKTLNTFNSAKVDAAAAKVAKNAANGSAYATLMSMLTVGKAIYIQNPEKRKAFSYLDLKRQVAGPGKTGVRFALKQAINELPVATAEITMQPGNYTLYPEKNGVCVELLASGKYSYTITAPGMTTMEGIVKVKAGSMRHVNVVFAKAEVVKPVATPEAAQPARAAASEVS